MSHKAMAGGHPRARNYQTVSQVVLQNRRAEDRSTMFFPCFHCYQLQPCSSSVTRAVRHFKQRVFIHMVDSIECKPV